ncbi:MAG: DUF3298 domain-containing protein [Clostridiales bacterium]|nr:DUF3298 domain-containing protein [Clostridiales bacterium]
MKIKKMLGLIMVLVCVFISVLPVWAEDAQGALIFDPFMPGQDGALEITGSIPEVVLQGNDDRGSALNREISDAYLRRLDAAKKDKLPYIIFSCDYYDGKYVSVVLRSETSSGEAYDTFNFEQSTGRPVYVSNILGANGTELANKFILNTIKKTPDLYNSDFAGIDESQRFYYDGSGVTFVFNKYDIAPASEGVVKFYMELSGILNISLSGMEYYVTNDNYRLKMIPLRYVCERLGFAVNWNSESETAVISKGTMSTSITLNSNSYTKGRTELKLEAPPTVIDGQTCVPISFFEECMGITYTVNANGAVVFSVYEQTEGGTQ